MSSFDLRRWSTGYGDADFVQKHTRAADEKLNTAILKAWETTLRLREVTDSRNMVSALWRRQLLQQLEHVMQESPTCRDLHSMLMSNSSIKWPLVERRVKRKKDSSIKTPRDIVPAHPAEVLRILEEKYFQNVNTLRRGMAKAA